MKTLKINYFEEKEAIKLLNQLRMALMELRKHKIMHWDIKMENIFVHNGSLKLGDFGFSKINIDKTSSKLGSKLTMAPEIVLNL